MGTPTYTGITYSTATNARVGGMVYDPVTNKLYSIINSNVTNVIVKLDPTTLVEQSRNTLSRVYGTLLLADGANGFLYLDCADSASLLHEHILKIRMSDLTQVNDLQVSDQTSTCFNYQVAAIDTTNGFLYWTGIDCATFANTVVKKIALSTFSVSATASFFVDQSSGGNVFTACLSPDGSKLYLISGEGSIWGGTNAHIVVVDTSSMTQIGATHSVAINSAAGAVAVGSNLYVVAESSSTSFTQVDASTFGIVTQVGNANSFHKEVSNPFNQEYSAIGYDPIQGEVYYHSRNSSISSDYITEAGTTPVAIKATTSISSDFSNGFFAIFPNTYVYVNGGSGNTEIAQFSIAAGSPPSFQPGPSSPTVGGIGSVVQIRGSGFTGATSVQFNGTSATFTVVSDSLITATVPNGATSGPISVTTGSGTTNTPTSFLVQSVLIGPAVLHYS